MKSSWFKTVAWILLFAFGQSVFMPNRICAQELYLPPPGQMVDLSPTFSPVVLKGIKLEADNPFRFHFYVDSGDGKIKGDDLKAESSKLIKYFLASLTIPEQDLWVNLSPYEKDRIVPKEFGQTEMGRDLLAQDYLLKQITASLIYPEKELGKEFWKKVYAQAQAKYGTINIPVNTFNKVWIVPEKAVVYENGGTAFVLENHLKVMLEEDYLAFNKSTNILAITKIKSDVNALGSQIVREIVIPALTKEVNEGKNFSQLRQVFYSLILATWYKKKVKDSILNRIYSNRKKTAGVDIYSTINKTNLSLPHTDSQHTAVPVVDPQVIYQQYLSAFKKGVYNYIKEEPDSSTGQSIPRKYFSGGFRMVVTLETRRPDEVKHGQLVLLDKAQLTDLEVEINVRTDEAMNAEDGMRNKEPFILDGYLSALNFKNWLLYLRIRQLIKQLKNPRQDKVNLLQNIEPVRRDHIYHTYKIPQGTVAQLNQTLIGFLGSTDPILQELLIKALAKSGDLHTIKHLMPFLGDERLRMDAIWSIAEICNLEIETKPYELYVFLSTLGDQKEIVVDALIDYIVHFDINVHKNDYRRALFPIVMLAGSLFDKGKLDHLKRLKIKLEQYNETFSGDIEKQFGFWMGIIWPISSAIQDVEERDSSQLSKGEEKNKQHEYIPLVLKVETTSALDRERKILIEAENRQTIERASISVREIASSIKELEGGVEIKNTVTDDVHIVGNKLVLLSALYNLINNGIKSARKKVQTGEEKPRVVLRISVEDDKVQFNITDNGEGIGDHLLAENPNTHRPVIYDLNVSETKGVTGLGTTEAWYAIKDHQGALEVKSELGRGTTFSIHLPIDHSMNSNNYSDTLVSKREGGINLNPVQMAIETKKEGADFKFNLNCQEIDSAQVVGIKFDIKQMLPVTNLPMLLGLSKINSFEESALK